MVNVTGFNEIISRGAEQEISFLSIASPPRLSSPVLMSAHLHLEEDLLLGKNITLLSLLPAVPP